MGCYIEIEEGTAFIFLLFVILRVSFPVAMLMRVNLIKRQEMYLEKKSGIFWTAANKGRELGSHLVASFLSLSHFNGREIVN